MTKRKASSLPTKKSNKRFKSSSQVTQDAASVPTPAPEGELFQRGGAGVLTALERKQIRAKATQDALFEEESDGQYHELSDSGNEAIERNDEADINLRKSKLKKRKSSSSIPVHEKTTRPSKIDGLSYKRMKKGMLVLGCITRIGKKDVTLALPNNLTGFVPMSSISSAFRRQLEEEEMQSSDEDDDGQRTDKHTTLSRYMRVGQYLRASVLSSEDSSKKHIQLSTMPRDVNVGIKPEDLQQHVVVQGEISSIEDHGAIIDLGLASGNAVAFVSSTELGDLKLSSLETGMPILCSVSSSKTNKKVVQLSADPKRFKAQNYVKNTTNVESLLPGTAIEFIVHESTEHGVRGKMMDLVDVTSDLVHSGQLSSQAIKVASPKSGKKTRARVIFVTEQNGHRQIGVSILPHILSLESPRSSNSDSSTAPTDSLPIASIVDEMKVIKVVPSRGLLLDVGVEQLPGFAHISRLSDKRVKELSAADDQWREGSNHRGRITGFNPIDGVFLVSLEGRILELPFLGLDDARPGQIVQGTVSKFKSISGEIGGVVLKITDSVSGLVPANHLSDVQLQFPEKKFRIGSTIKARVLSIDSDQRRLTLTCKKTLLNSKADVWSSYSNVHIGSQSPGIIVAFLPSGALVEFYNRLKGFLPTSEMSESFIRDPKEHFRIGQAINLRAISIIPDERRLVVSCRQDTELTDITEQFLEKLEVGTIVTGKVSEKLADEFVLDIDNTSIKAILPISHLVDGSEAKCAQAAKRIRVEQTLQELAILVLNKSKRYIRLTKRASLVKALSSQKMPSALSSLIPGKEVTGLVKNITSIGVFVQFANSLTGLLHKSQITGEARNADQFGLHKDQTITARVLSTDPDQQRFFLTQKEGPQDTANKIAKANDSNDAAAIVDPIGGTSTSFNLGQLTKAKVIAVKDTQLNVQLADGVQGRIDISQIFDTWDQIEDKKHPLRSYHKGQFVNVKILGIHDARNHKFLPLTHKRGNAVFELTAKPSDQVENAIPRLALKDMKPGDTHLCFVNNVRRDHLWVNISTEIRGRIDVLDLTEDAQEMEDLAKHYPIGRVIQARVVKVDTAENHLDLTAFSAEKVRPQTIEDLVIGQIVSGKISKILDKLVVVQISELLAAAIHICDLEDDFSKADPKALRIHQAVTAVVTELDKERKDVWLSKRPSKLHDLTIAVQDPELHSISEVHLNDVRRGFVKNVTDKGLFISLSRTLTAFIRVSELSDQFLKDWKSKFAFHQLVTGKVISVDASANQMQLSLKESVVDANYTAPLQFEDFAVGKIYHGRVRAVEDYGVFVVLDKSKNISGLCHKSELADGSIPSPKDLYEVGDPVSVKILKLDKNSKRINLGMKASYLTSGEDSEVDDMSIENDEPSLEIDGGVKIEVSSEDHRDTETKPALATKKTNQSIQELDLGGFDWSGGLADQQSDEEMLDLEEQPLEPKKRKSGTAAIQVDRTGELDTNGAQSISDFERLLMGQPNSSFLWLSYMAFHLQLSEVEKARQVAERALRTINNESKATQDEVLNIWIGFLNLENSYGDDDTIDEVFKRACVYSDPQEVYTRLASIYIQSDKQDVRQNHLPISNSANEKSRKQIPSSRK